MKTENEESNQWRCTCGKLLFKGVLVGVIELKCSRCHKVNHLRNYEPLSASRKSFTVLLSFSGKILEMSDSIEDVTGLHPNQLIGKNASEFIGRAQFVAIRFALAKMKQAQGDYTQIYTSVGKVKAGARMVDVSYTTHTVPYQGDWAVLYNIELGKNASIQFRKQLLKRKGYRPNQKLWDFEVQLDGTICGTSQYNHLGYKKDVVDGKSIFEVLHDNTNFNPKDVLPKMKANEVVICTVTVQCADQTTATFDLLMKDKISLIEGNNNYYLFLKQPA